MKLHIEEFLSFLELMFGARRAVHASSRPGSGKSSIARKYAKLQNKTRRYAYCEVNGATDNIADARGYLMPREARYIDVDGQERVIMEGKYTYPYWAFDKFTGEPAFMFDGMLIVIEEWGQGDLDFKKAMASLVQDRRMGEYHFPHADVLLLSNRAEDRAGVTRDLDHIINRRTDVEIVTGVEGTIVMGQERGWSPITLAFAARNEDILFGDSVPEKQGPFLTNRSLEGLDEIIREAERKDMPLDHPHVLVAAAGTIGEGNAHRYMAFARARHEIPTLSAILRDPEGADVPIKLDLLMFLVFDLAAKTKRENMDGISRYIKRLPSDMHVSYFETVARRDPELVSTANFSAYARDNIDLLTAIAVRKGSI